MKEKMEEKKYDNFQSKHEFIIKNYLYIIFIKYDYIFESKKIIFELYSISLIEENINFFSLIDSNNISNNSTIRLSFIQV